MGATLRARNLVALAGVAAVLASSHPASAQVKIRERVVVGSEETAKSASVAAFQPYVIMPRDGVLNVEFLLGQRYQSPLPATSTLGLLVNGLNAGSETLVSRLDSQSTNFDFCEIPYGSIPVNWIGNVYNYVAKPDPPPVEAASKQSAAQSEASTWNAGAVSEGDTVAFDFDGGLLGHTYETKLRPENDSTWFVQGGAPGCFNNISGAFWADRVDAMVTLLPDTLQIHFSPEADTTIYPQPGLVIDVDVSVLGASGSGNVIFEITNHEYPHPAGPDTLMYFLDGVDTTLVPQVEELTGDTASTQLIATQYWGVAEVTAHYVLNGDTLHTKTKKWPEDNDADGIADAWEVANGGMALGGALMDASYDGESTMAFTTRRPRGDGISKLREYQGVLIGSTLKRLNPLRREILADYDRHPYGGWAVGRAQTEFDIDIISVDGLAMTDSRRHTNPEVDTVIAGSSVLLWTGGLPKGEWFHFVLLDSVWYGDPALDTRPPRTSMTTGQENQYYRGQVVVSGTYQWAGKSFSDPTCPSVLSPLPASPASRCQANWDPDWFLMSWGWTLELRAATHRYYVAQTFFGVAENIWSASGNSLPQNAGSAATPPEHLFEAAGAHPAHPASYTAFFPVSTSGSMTNPFDRLALGLLTNPSGNDSPGDGIVMGLTKEQFLQRNALHELAHGLGLKHGGYIPDKGLSAMRTGIGPAKTDSFLPHEKSELYLR